MINRFHLFAHCQYAVTLAQAKGGMDNYISPCQSVEDAKDKLHQLNDELGVTAGGIAKYDYAQVAVLSEHGRLVVVATFDAASGWKDAHNSCGCGSGACDGNGPLSGYIVRRPVQDRSVSFDIVSDEESPMGYVLVDDPRPGEEIYHGRFEPRPESSTHLVSHPDTTVYDPVGAFTKTLFGE